MADISKWYVAVSYTHLVCKGMKMRRLDIGKTAVIALFFGGFQALMPLIGWAPS